MLSFLSHQIRKCRPPNVLCSGDITHWMMGPTWGMLKVLGDHSCMYFLFNYFITIWLFRRPSLQGSRGPEQARIIQSKFHFQSNTCSKLLKLECFLFFGIINRLLYIWLWSSNPIGQNFIIIPPKLFFFPYFRVFSDLVGENPRSLYIKQSNLVSEYQTRKETGTGCKFEGWFEDWWLFWKFQINQTVMILSDKNFQNLILKFKSLSSPLSLKSSSLIPN